MTLVCMWPVLKRDAVEWKIAMADDKPFECTQPGCGMVCRLWFGFQQFVTLCYCNSSRL